MDSPSVSSGPLPTPMPKPGPAFPDRRAGLAVFGVLLIILGLGVWGLMVLMGLAWTVSLAQVPEAKLSSMLPAMLAYGLAGAILVTLGIGSLRARRWARALMVVASVNGFVFGLMGLGLLGWMLPGMFRKLPAGADTPPEGVLLVILVVVLGVVAVFFVALPFGFYLFYRSPHVRATCETANPRPCWTDACAFPVLTSGLWLVFSGVTLVSMPFTNHGAYPLFGRFVTGSLGWILWWGLAMVALIAGCGVLRRSISAWWLGLIAMLLMGLSSVMTYAQVDPGEMYAAMGVDGLQLEQIQKLGLAEPGFLIGSAVVPLAPFLFMMVWAWFHLRRVAPAKPAPGAGPGPG